MDLLRELVRRQAKTGYLSNEDLREIARIHRVPLYRLEGLVSFYTHFRRSPPARWRIDVCRDVCCSARQGGALAALRKHLNGRDDVEIHEVSCLGRCDRSPAVALNDRPLAPITLADTDHLLALLGGGGSTPLTPTETWPQPVQRQWRSDPYTGANDRYSHLRNLVAESGNLPAYCIQQLLAADLRGSGGAGFSAGKKWEFVARAPGPEKYVICNADESEPGTFKDREILRTLPHLVIEGMVYAALTVGASSGIVFLRHEYGPEEEVLQQALNDARDRGILGANAAGSGRPFDIEIFVSPGGYILGEETALLEALEDKRGEPRNKPPYPGTHGLWGKPTVINNVETFALAAAIIDRTADWWNDCGVNGCRGLKFVCISGDVAQPGVYEVDMGTTFREVIQMAGGVPQGKQVKAFLPGGASSNFLGADKLDTPVDFGAVQKAGSMLGTGAVIVFDESRDLFDAAINITRFFRNESCGKCVPCRVGTEKAVALLQGVQRSARGSSQLPILGELAQTLEQTSICGLGQVALAPVLSLLRQFPEEIVSQDR